jgi:hypothetical protein
MCANSIARSLRPHTDFSRRSALVSALSGVALNMSSGVLAEEGDAISLAKADGVSLHLQSTFTPRGNLPCRAPYSGEQSLDPKGQAAEDAPHLAPVRAPR